MRHYTYQFNSLLVDDSIVEKERERERENK